MSVSFGLQKAGSKRKVPVIAAFEEGADEPEPELTDEQKLTDSQRLQASEYAPY